MGHGTEAIAVYTMLCRAATGKSEVIDTITSACGDLQ